MKTTTPINRDYATFVADLKSRIASARLNAARSVNRELVLLYWDIGQAIVERQEQLRWGNSVVDMISADLRREFPNMAGFSSRNLWDMRRFFEAFRSPEILRQTAAELTLGNMRSSILRQPVAELDGEKLAQVVRELLASIPWGHHLLILNKTETPAARLYYLRATARFGWSRSVLLNQVKAGAYERARIEKKTHNFESALPEHFAEQAEEALKSRYNLGFLGIGRAIKERELEKDKSP